MKVLPLRHPFPIFTVQVMSLVYRKVEGLHAFKGNISVRSFSLKYLEVSHFVEKKCGLSGSALQKYPTDIRFCSRLLQTCIFSGISHIGTCISLDPYIKETSLVWVLDNFRI